MAEPLKEFPELTRKSKYEWDLWFDGRPWRLRRSEDYTVSTASMRALASKTAKKRGHRLRTSLFSDEDGEGLVIQAYSENEEGES